jgi:hypothetical protein
LLAIDSTLAAQNYTSMTIGFSAPTLTFCKQPNPGTPGCASGTVQTITGNLSTPQIPLTLALSSGQKVGMEVNLDINKTVTISSQAVTAVNLGTASAFSTKALPPSTSSLAAGQIDFFENLIGVVTVASASQISVLTASQGTVTATPSASTFNVANCILTNLACSPAVGQFVSIDTAVNDDGSLALLEFDPIDSTQIVWLEGVVTSIPSSTTQFQIVVTDESPNTTGGTTTLHTGEIINVTLVGQGGGTGSPFPFTIDSKGYPIPANSFAGATDTSQILPGMTVGLHVVTFTAPSASTPGTMTSDIVTLRFTPVPGAVQSFAPPNTLTLTSTSLPPFFGLTSNPVVQIGTGTPATNFDGASSSSFPAVGQTVAIRALYFGQNTTTPLVAAKVRAF